MKSQAKKAEQFYAMHHKAAPFLLPNAWDAGSAKIMAAKGFKAIGTTSIGVDHIVGRKTAKGGRDAVIENVRVIAEATDLPVSADLEDCYAGNAEGIAETIRMAADAGAVGASIEDAIYGQPGYVYPPEEAVARVEAAMEAARALPFKFTLCARCENFFIGKPDLEDTITRIKAYAATGVDVIYAPGITTREQVKAVVEAVEQPVNVLLGIKGHNLTMTDMRKLGVKRVSLGSALYRVAISAAIRAMDEMSDSGSFGFTEDFLPLTELDDLMG